jgi:hypothetical protein
MNLCFYFSLSVKLLTYKLEVDSFWDLVIVPTMPFLKRRISALLSSESSIAPD